MKPEYLTIPCWSNDEGDLTNCTAFLDRDALEEIKHLIADIKAQKPHSTILQILTGFTFDDRPNDLQDRYMKYKDEENPEVPPTIYGMVDEEKNLFFVDELPEEQSACGAPHIWGSELIIFYGKNAETHEDIYYFYYEMRIKHCTTLVTTKTLSEDDLDSILNDWDASIEANDIETEKILKDNEDEAAWGN